MNLLMRLFILMLVGLFCAVFSFADTIQPGDVIRVTNSEHAELSKRYKVSPKGAILMEYIGVIQVEGQSPEQLAETLTKALLDKAVIKSGDVDVAILPWTVIVTGACEVTGEIDIERGMTLEQLFDIVKPNSDADMTSIRFHQFDGSETVYNYDLNKKNNDTASNPVLTPGDTIFVVPFSSAGRIIILGAVTVPQIMNFEEGMTPLKVIEKAGGANAFADLNNVRLTRKSDNTQFTLDLMKDGGNYPLKPGDMLFIPELTQRSYVWINGAVKKPGMMVYTNGIQLTKLLQACEPLPNADMKKVKIQRVLETGKKLKITVDVEKIASGAASDFILQPNDRIEVTVKKRGSGIGSYIPLILSLYFLL